MPIYPYGAPELARWISRSATVDDQLSAAVAEIIRDVRTRGVEAVLDVSRQFDCPALNSLLVTEQEWDVTVPADQAEAIKVAIDRVTDFHETQLAVLTGEWDELPGGWGWRTDVCEGDETGFEGQRMLAVSRVGVYVPGGRAAYPSSVVMNVVPARVAGVKEIVIATPCRVDGTVHPLVLFAARELGISTIIKAGGAAAVAALAYGVEGCPRVDVIAGPGNSYVNEAKRQVWGSVGLDGYAGPSEVAVVVDGTVDARLSAADLLTQVEHAPDNVGVLIGLDPDCVEKVLKSCNELLTTASRAIPMFDALNNSGVAVIVNSIEEAAEFLNELAPEHASFHVENFGHLAELTVNCGCIMLGPDSAQSAGDYCSGPSHTLPTGGAARFASPVSVQTFLKTQSVSMLTRSDIAELASTIDVLANAEGFPIHGRGATIRLES